MEQRNHAEKPGEKQDNIAHHIHYSRLEAAEQYLSNFSQLEAARDYLSKLVPPSQYLSKFIPVGYRFNPTDKELILHYLLPMINDSELPINAMHNVNIYKHTPDDLTANYAAQSDNVWYFFTSRDRKYPKGFRPDRKASDGYWKATGADKAINHQGKKIGSRKSLVFYEGKPPKGRKTQWIMHEFRVADDDSSQPNTNKRKRDEDDGEDTSMRLDDFVLSRIYKKELGSGRMATRQQRQEKVVDNTEQEDEKVVEENVKNAVEAAFEQEDQQVVARPEIGEIFSRNINVQINAQQVAARPEIGESSLRNNINVQINAPQMARSGMNQGCVAQINVPQVDRSGMNPVYGSLEGQTKYELPPPYGSVEGQMMNNYHTSSMVDQDLDLTNFFASMDDPADLSSIFQGQGGGHNSFILDFDDKFPS